MSTLVVIDYETEVKAEEVRLALLKMEKDCLVDPIDAVVVVRDEKGQGSTTSPLVLTDVVLAADAVDALGLGVDIGDAPVAVPSHETIGDAFEHGNRLLVCLTQFGPPLALGAADKAAGPHRVGGDYRHPPCPSVRGAYVGASHSGLIEMSPEVSRSTVTAGARRRSVTRESL